MNRCYIVIGVFLLAGLSLTSCHRNSARSLQNIQDLHDCALLVRLPNLDDKVEKLVNAGKVNKAEAVRKYNRSYNQGIMRDFKEHYSFSPVFFFLSDDTEKVKIGDTKGIFLDDDLKKDPEKNLPCTNYLIMDYGDIREDSSTRMSAKWVVKDKNFRALQRPFPYHLVWGKSNKEIEKFHYKFLDYYESATEE